MLVHAMGAQCARLRPRVVVVKRKVCRCPGGSTRAGATCANINECLQWPCQNGGTCVDREPARRYDCICAFGYTGHDCELELLASGIITPSRDFIIAIIVCLFLLLGEHNIIYLCMLLFHDGHLFSLQTLSLKTSCFISFLIAIIIVLDHN